MVLESNKIKISFLSVFYPYRGGIAQFSDALLSVLTKKNKVQAINFKRQYPNFLFPGKTQFVENPDSEICQESLPLIDSINPFTFFKTKNIINQFSPDVLIVSYWMTFFAFCKGFITKKSKAKVKIALLHNLIPHEKKFYDSLVNRYFVKQFDGFIVMSEIVKNDLLSIKSDARIMKLEHPNYQLFGEKISKNEALTILQKDNIVLDSYKKTILFFGLIRDYKGLDLLIDAFAMLDDSYQLLIVGECYRSFEKYQMQIDKTKNGSNIIVVNKFILDDEVGVYFSVADVCVLPYKSATQSGIIAVANQFLVPVIATNVGGLSESVQDNKTGIIIQELDAKKIKEGICHFFDENLNELFQQNIAEKNKQQSWDYFAEKTLEFAKNLQKT